MIPTKTRGNRRMKALKLSKNLERIYKEEKCRECSVVVTPMDFAKILGRFTKVKIQYESSSKSKPKQTNVVSPNSRLKAKENGIIHGHRTYNPHPAKKTKSYTPQIPTSNVLKESNSLLKTAKAHSEYNVKQLTKSRIKYYGVVFDKPTTRKKDIQNKVSLQDLVSNINKSMLPNSMWCIEYLPNGEPKDDKIYDRIAAELEDLMYNEKTKSSNNVKDIKNDEFPSILDILNENTKDGTAKSNTVNLESSDVEAMLMGNTSPSIEPSPIQVDNAATVNSFINEATQIQIKSAVKLKTEEGSTMDDNPESPSILDEPFQKDGSSTETSNKPIEEDTTSKVQPTNPSSSQTALIDENDNNNTSNKNSTSRSDVTQVIFKKMINGTCSKSVTCPNNLKYSISILGKSVEFLGAPNYISSIEDLQVLLQIVEESELNNVYVLQ